MNRHCNKQCGLHADVSLFEIVAVIVTMIIVSAILLGAADGMLKDTTTRPHIEARQ